MNAVTKFKTNKLPTFDKFDTFMDQWKQTFDNDLFLDTFEPFRVKNASFPPYNTIKEDENTIRIEMALAGFTKEEIEVTIENNILSIASKKEETDSKDENDYIYRGIAKRSFVSRFRLAEHSEVTDCTLKDGILTILVSQHIPEDKLPKVININ